MDIINEMVDEVEKKIQKVADLKKTFTDDSPLLNNTISHLREEGASDIDRVLNVHSELENMKTFADENNKYIEYIENEIIKDQFDNNIEIQDMFQGYNEVDERYKLGKNMSSARDILKIDSYDRNIEENFFIMYYLLSYGVVGYFMYKLIKL